MGRLFYFSNNTKILTQMKLIIYQNQNNIQTSVYCQDIVTDKNKTKIINILRQSSYHNNGHYIESRSFSPINLIINSNAILYTCQW